MLASLALRDARPGPRDLDARLGERGPDGPDRPAELVARPGDDRTGGRFGPVREGLGRLVQDRGRGRRLARGHPEERFERMLADLVHACSRAPEDRGGGRLVELTGREAVGHERGVEERGEQERLVSGVAGAAGERAARATEHACVRLVADLLGHEPVDRLHLVPERRREVADTVRTRRRRRHIAPGTCLPPTP